MDTVDNVSAGKTSRYLSSNHLIYRLCNIYAVCPFSPEAVTPLTQQFFKNLFCFNNLYYLFTFILLKRLDSLQFIRAKFFNAFSFFRLLLSNYPFASVYLCGIDFAERRGG